MNIGVTQFVWWGQAFLPAEPEEAGRNACPPPNQLLVVRVGRLSVPQGVFRFLQAVTQPPETLVFKAF